MWNYLGNKKVLIKREHVSYFRFWKKSPSAWWQICSLLTLCQSDSWARHLERFPTILKEFQSCWTLVGCSVFTLQNQNSQVWTHQTEVQISTGLMSIQWVSPDKSLLLVLPQFWLLYGSSTMKVWWWFMQSPLNSWCWDVSVGSKLSLVTLMNSSSAAEVTPGLHLLVVLSQLHHVFDGWYIQSSWYFPDWLTFMS